MKKVKNNKFSIYKARFLKKVKHSKADVLAASALVSASSYFIYNFLISI